MDISNFKTIISKSITDLFRNPILFVPPAIGLAALNLLAFASSKLKFFLSNNITLSIWLVFVSVLSLSILSFLFSSLIGASNDVSSGKKSSLIRLIYYGKKFWFKNLLIILVILVFYNIIFFASLGISFILGKSINLSENPATLIFYLFYFIGLLLLNFFALSSFYLIIKDLSVKNSIKKSSTFVKNNYLYVLSVIILFFAISQSVYYLGRGNQLIPELISTILLLPYISLVLTKFALSEKNK